MLFLARVENLSHCASQSSDALRTSRFGICVKRLSALRSVSTVAIRGSITICVGASLINALMDLDKVVRPIMTTV